MIYYKVVNKFILNERCDKCGKQFMGIAESFEKLQMTALIGKECLKGFWSLIILL